MARAPESASELVAAADLTRLLPRVLAVLPCAVAVVDCGTSHIVAANPAWLRMAETYGAGRPGGRLQGMFPDAETILDETLLQSGAVTRRAVAAIVPPAGVATWWDLELAPHPDVASTLIVTARDTTEAVMARRQADDAETALSATDVRLGLAQEATGIGIWEWNLATDTQAWSAEQFRLFGLDPQRDTPPTYPQFIQAVHPDDRAALAATIDSGFRNGQGAHHLEYRIARADTGEERWLLSLARSIASASDGRPLRMTGVNIDITKRRREHEALVKSEAWLRLSFEAAQIFAWDWELATGRVTWMDGLEKSVPVGKRGFGGTIEDFRALVHPDDSALVATAMQDALSGRTPNYSIEFRMRRVDGSWRWTRARGVVVRDANGVPLRLMGVDYDLTEQRRNEAALRDNERRLRLAMEIGGLGAWETDMASGVKLRDESLSALLGLPPETASFPARKWFEFVHPDDRARVRERHDLAAGGGAPFEEIFRVVRADGAERIFASRAVMARPGRLIGIAQDVTEAHEEQQLLRESRDRFQGLFDSMVEFVGLLSPDGTIRKANRAALEFAGAALADVVGRKLWESPWFSGSAEAAAQVKQAVACAAEGKFVRYQVNMAGANRSAVVDFSLRPVRGDDGAVMLLVPEGRDVTDMKRVEQALAAAASRYRTLVDALPLHAFTAAADGSSEFSNRGWFEYSGQDANEAVGFGWARALHPQDRERTLAAWAACLHSGEPFQAEHRLRAADGSYEWFLTRAVRLPGEPDGAFRWYGGSIEISHLVARRERNAERAQEMAEKSAAYVKSLLEAAFELESEIRRRAELQTRLLQAQKLEAIGQLTGSVAHDFNNVLAAIAGSYTLIRRRTSSTQVHELVERGESAVRRAKRLIDHLTTFVRHGPVSPEMLDLGKVLLELQDLVNHAAGERASCTIDVAPDIWPVIADAHELGIALLNLVANGRDAMPHGGIIGISARNADGADVPGGLLAGDYVVISVRDRGEGMPPETLARAKDAFFTTKAQGKGTGLGLPMVQNFATQCGGAVRIDSTQGVGTTVHIVLPRAAMVTSSTQRMAALKQISSPSFELHGGAAILLVEDDDQVRPLTADYLRDLGYTVVEAASAESATVLAHTRERWDLLITDVLLPGAEGIALAARLRTEHPDLPVLFMTGQRARPDLQNEMVLQKPFSDTLLARAVLLKLGRRITLDTDAAEPLLSRLAQSPLRPMLVAWHMAKADGQGYPSPALLNAEQFGLAANAFVVAVEEADPPLFHYQHVGRALIEELGRAQGGQLVSADAGGDAVFGTLDGAYRRCVRTKAPVYQSARYDFGDGAPARFERLILPASDDGLAITHLIGIVFLKIQPDEGA